MRLVIVRVYLSQLTEQTHMKCGRLLSIQKGENRVLRIWETDPTRKESNFCLDNVNYQSPPTTRYHVFLNLTPSIFHKENHMKSMSFQAIVLHPQ